MEEPSHGGSYEFPVFNFGTSFAKQYRIDPEPIAGSNDTPAIAGIAHSIERHNKSPISCPCPSNDRFKAIGKAVDHTNHSRAGTRVAQSLHLRFLGHINLRRPSNRSLSNTRIGIREGSPVLEYHRPKSHIRFDRLIE